MTPVETRIAYIVIRAMVLVIMSQIWYPKLQRLQKEKSGHSTMQNPTSSLYSGVHLLPLRFVQLAFKLLGLLGKFSVVVGVQLQQGRCVASLGDGNKLDLNSLVLLANPGEPVIDPFQGTCLVGSELVAVDALAGRQGKAVAITIRFRKRRENIVAR